MTDTSPPLPEGYDQAIIHLDLRRQDPPSPVGSPSPDLAELFSAPNPVFTQMVIDIAEHLGFDPELSIISVSPLVDYETGSGFVTLAQLRDMQNTTEPDSDEEPETGTGDEEGEGSDEPGPDPEPDPGE